MTKRNFEYNVDTVGGTMNRYEVAHIKDGSEIYYYIRCSEDMSIVAAPSKYLKHKTKSHRSPNTIRRIAFSLSYYLTYLDSLNMTLSDVYEMKYDAQHIHFTDFLAYLQAGKHTDEDRNKLPNNATCNAYLKDVFGWFQFLELQEETLGNLKVLESHNVTFRNSIGLKFSLARKTFRGYLREDNQIGRTIERDSILVLLKACPNIRDQVLLLLLAETGFRIGELLGIRIGSDIDVHRHVLKVQYREENINMARAKNAENRRAVISDATYHVLLGYLSKYHELLSRSGYLFVNLSGESAGKPLKVNAVYAMLLRLEKKTGIKATPHMLRHYFANERRKNGWDISLIASALGHKQITTTEKYLNIGGEELEEASRAYYESSKDLLNIDELL